MSTLSSLRAFPVLSLWLSPCVAFGRLASFYLLFINTSVCAGWVCRRARLCACTSTRSGRRSRCLSAFLPFSVKISVLPAWVAVLLRCWSFAEPRELPICRAAPMTASRSPRAPAPRVRSLTILAQHAMFPLAPFWSGWMRPFGGSSPRVGCLVLVCSHWRRLLSLAIRRRGAAAVLPALGRDGRHAQAGDIPHTHTHPFLWMSALWIACPPGCCALCCTVDSPFVLMGAS